ncbi:MAG: hypothetical protein MJY88_00835 [Bacteroidales bacterium]|nr:hypothetical protein [Bacteroidales bacterium]
MDTDEVSLPGVGTFVAEIVPSTFSDKGYTINPPYRRLSFRQRQTEEDTMLADFYASSNNLDKASAGLIINDFLRELKDVLQEKKTIIFPGLGRLRATRENNFFFVADEDLDIYPAGFGLESVSLKTHEETPEAVAAAISSLKDIMDKPETMVPSSTAEPPVEEPVVVEEVTPVVAEEPATVVEEPAMPEEPVVVEVEVAAVVEEPVIEEADPVEVEEPVVPEEPAEEPRKSPLEEAEYYVNPDHRYHSSIQTGKNILRIVLWAVAAVAALLILFVLLAHIAPDLIDRILYTKEELEILRY